MGFVNDIVLGISGLTPDPSSPAPITSLLDLMNYIQAWQCLSLPSKGHARKQTQTVQGDGSGKRKACHEAKNWWGKLRSVSFEMA